MKFHLFIGGWVSGSGGGGFFGPSVGLGLERCEWGNL